MDSPIQNALTFEENYNANSPPDSHTSSVGDSYYAASPPDSQTSSVGSPNVADLESGINTLNCTSPSPPLQVNLLACYSENSLFPVTLQVLEMC